LNYSLDTHYDDTVNRSVITNLEYIKDSSATSVKTPTSDTTQRSKGKIMQCIDTAAHTAFSRHTAFGWRTPPL